MTYDLHVHSNCSRHVRRIAPPPAKVVKYAKEAGLLGIALTDHDTGSGIEEAEEAAKKIGIDLISGIEMSFGYKQSENFYVEGEILGYFIDPDYPLIKQVQGEMEDKRRLRDSGLRKALDIPKKQIQEFVHDETYSRDDLADYLVDKGIAVNRKDAYRILKPEGKSLVEREKTPLEDVVKIIHAAGGVPIVAHFGIIINDYKLWPEQAFGREDLKEKKGIPPEYKPERDFEKTLLPVFLELGIKGFEIYPYSLVGKGISVIKHGFFNTYAHELNQRYNLIDNIKGSDCHFMKDILTEVGCWATELRVVEQLKSEHLKIKNAL
ncbi:PHP domain-containing protein [Candidatus Woesearchaeota archaeon]|nr:PHP domain-containing protein [Candidatus Woesearchaeota archaeon]